MIIIKSPPEIEKMTRACRIVAGALRELEKMVHPGVTTRDLERHAERMVLAQGAALAFKGYRGYPSGICASVNDRVVHGIPSGEKLADGDIVSIDLGVYLDGFYGDAAVTVGVGAIGSETERLLRVTKDALAKGIAQAVPGKRVSDVSNAIQRHVESHGYSVVRSFVGHGIGMALHEDPQVPNYGPPGQGPRLRKGMTLAIEPMVNVGRPGARVLDDKWTAVTEDGSFSAHFEHCVAITQNGPVILTQ